MNNPPVPGVADRVRALVVELIESNDMFPSMYKGVIKSLILNYVNKLDDKTAGDIIGQMRDSIFPFLLYGENGNDKD